MSRVRWRGDVWWRISSVSSCRPAVFYCIFRARSVVHNTFQVWDARLPLARYKIIISTPYGCCLIWVPSSSRILRLSQCISLSSFGPLPFHPKGQILGLMSPHQSPLRSSGYIEISKRDPLDIMYVALLYWYTNVHNFHRQFRESRNPHLDNYKYFNSISLITGVVRGELISVVGSNI